MVVLLVSVTVIVAAAAADATALGGRIVRRLTDEQVIENHRPYLYEWRNRFNRNDLLYCREAYHEHAALMVRLGPAASLFKEAGIEDPAIMRGRQAIENFWETARKSLGVKDLRAYEEEGEFAPVVFAVDDNTVIVGGRVSFNAGAAEGHIFAETWTRDVGGGLSASSWRIQNSMLAIEKAEVATFKSSLPPPPPSPLSPPIATPSPSSLLPQRSEEEKLEAVRQEALGKEKALKDKVALEKEKELGMETKQAETEKALEEMKRKNEALKVNDEALRAEEKADEKAIPVHTKDAAKSAGVPGEIGSDRNDLQGAITKPIDDEESGGHPIRTTVMWIVAVLASLFLAFYLYRAKLRRVSMTIGGPDSLLG